jgi:hypothetical protein
MSTTDEALISLITELVGTVALHDMGKAKRLGKRVQQALAAPPVQEPTDVWFYKCFRSDPPAQPAPAVPAPLTDDVRGLLVIEHLGPNALLHKPMSIYEAFHMGIDAAEAAHGIKKAVKTALQP